MVIYAKTKNMRFFCHVSFFLKKQLVMFEVQVFLIKVSEKHLRFKQFEFTFLSVPVKLNESTSHVAKYLNKNLDKKHISAFHR